MPMAPGIALIAVAAAAPLALVTTTKGAVTFGGAAAPAVPFTLTAGQTLDLAADASVVLLYQGKAFQLTGPRKVDPATLASPAADPAAGALEDLFSRQVSTAVAGASRAAAVALARPVPGTAVLDLHQVRWSCGGCGVVPVEVRTLRGGAVLWSGSGEDHVDYAGPALSPGPHVLRVGTADFSFLVPATDERARAEAARQTLAGIADPSVAAGVWFATGLYTEGLYALDAAVSANPKYAELRAVYAAKAGVEP